MVTPFIRAVGGKRQIVDAILASFPPSSDWTVYVEPFLGGGAVYCALHTAGVLDDKMVILGDADPDLFKLWQAVRDGPMRLYDSVFGLFLDATQNPEETYYRERDRWNAGKRTPARHLFLRMNAFNGLWRQNRQGEMNTPWRKEPPRAPAIDLLEMSRALNDPFTELLDWDFRQYEDPDGDVFIGPRTVVYLDPPYLNTFTKYTRRGWVEEDLICLVRLCQVWTERGAHVVLSHSDDPIFRSIVAAHWNDMDFREVQARRAINSDGAGRGPVPELIVYSRRR